MATLILALDRVGRETPASFAIVSISGKLAADWIRWNAARADIGAVSIGVDFGHFPAYHTPLVALPENPAIMPIREVIEGRQVYVVTNETVAEIERIFEADSVHQIQSREVAYPEVKISQSGILFVGTCGGTTIGSEIVDWSVIQEIAALAPGGSAPADRPAERSQPGVSQRQLLGNVLEFLESLGEQEDPVEAFDLAVNNIEGAIGDLRDAMRLTRFSPTTFHLRNLIDHALLPSEGMSAFLHDEYAEAGNAGGRSSITLDDAHSSFVQEPRIATAVIHGVDEDDLTDKQVRDARQEIDDLVNFWGGFYPVEPLLLSQDPAPLRDPRLRLYIGGREIAFEEVRVLVSQTEVDEPNLHLTLTHEGLIGDLVASGGAPTGKTFGLEYGHLSERCH